MQKGSDRILSFLMRIKKKYFSVIINLFYFVVEIRYIMFRKIFILFIFLFSTVSVFGQVFKFGVLVDPTITWLRSDVNEVTRAKARLGLDIGMSADYYFTANYAFSSGISLFNTGGTLQYVNGIANFHTKEGKITVAAGGKVKYKLQYVKIPAGIKFKTHLIGRMIYSANLGFDPMFRVSARAAINVRDNLKVNEEIKLLNLGWHFGVGSQYSLGQESSIFGGLSFMNIFTDMTKPSNHKITSGNLMLRIGMMF